MPTTRPLMRSQARPALSALAVLSIAGALSSGAAADGVLELRSGAIITDAPSNLLVKGGKLDGGAVFIVQLDGPLTPVRQAALDRLGLDRLEFLPQSAFIVRARGAVQSAEVAALGFVTWVGAFRPDWKLDPELGGGVSKDTERAALAARGEVRAIVVLFAGEAPDEALGALAGVGARVIEARIVGGQWWIDATLGLNAARGLARLGSVQFIEDAPEVTLRNDSNRWILQGNTSGQTPIWSQGLRGEAQIAGLIDTVVRESHCMFDDSVVVGAGHRKILAQRGGGGGGFHGTHVAGTIAGDATPHGEYTTNDGLAFRARLTTTNLDLVLDNPASLEAQLNAAHADGARVHSNSWGDDGTRAYTTWCRQIDLFTRANEADVVAFAITNLGVLTTPENSMNVLAVGASRDAPSQNLHCSGGVGPTADGRRKPEIYAPGCGTISANSATTCGTDSGTGTSMACPAVAAACLLARQYFTEGFHATGTRRTEDGFEPSGALLRATVINGGVDMTGVSGYPSNLEGWGRVQLDRSLTFAGGGDRLQVVDVRNASGLTTGQAMEFPMIVASDGGPLRITLAFTAPAASVNASNPVINDIDLEVLAPGGVLYRGNVFSGGVSATGGTADPRNTVERVVLASAPAGPYILRVHAAAVNQGLQGFAIAAVGALAPPADCEADFDGDGFVTGADFDAFVGEFASGNASGDFDGDGFVTGLDFDAFVEAFESGC